LLLGFLAPLKFISLEVPYLLRLLTSKRFRVLMRKEFCPFTFFFSEVGWKAPYMAPGLKRENR